nr:MAG TPA: zinc-ribbon domain protein [Caudoviricetes sp.]
MKDGKFKCPYCGSTHFEHVFPKKKSIPVFLRQCLRCGKYKVWVYKNKKKKFERCAE